MVSNFENEDGDAKIQTNLRNREACEFHELVEGKGPRAHKLAVESSGSLCRKGLEVR